MRGIPPLGIIYANVYLEKAMTETVTYSVPGMHCGHCEAAVSRELEAVRGVESVDVDLDTKLVKITGTHLDDGALRTAIDEAGYDAEEVVA